MKHQQYERHPLSAVWGDMPAEQFEDLKADIKANGLRDPILIYDGMVLDGWHRYRALVENGIDTHGNRRLLRVFEVPNAKNDLAAASLVISKNAHRRHMKPGERAAAILKSKRLGGAKWAERGGDRQSGKTNRSNDPFTEDSQTETITAKQVAKEAGISVETAKRKIAKKKVEEVIDHAQGKPTAPLNQKQQADAEALRERGVDPEATRQEMLDSLKDRKETPTPPKRLSLTEKLREENRLLRNKLIDAREKLEDARETIACVEEENKTLRETIEKMKTLDYPSDVSAHFPKLPAAKVGSKAVGSVVDVPSDVDIHAMSEDDFRNYLASRISGGGGTTS